MNDTNKKDTILNFFDKTSVFSSSDIAAKIDGGVSLVTIKRYLSELFKENMLERLGAGRSVQYRLTKKGLFGRNINLGAYLSLSPDARLNDTNFNFEVFDKPYVALFSNEEISKLEEATYNYRKNAEDSEPEAHNKELLRFIIEFSWKTSQIEGNTYDLLSTERLLTYGEKASGHTEFEAQMIINQKKAVEFVLENIELWNAPKLSSLEMLHSFVADKLGIKKNLRRSMVGITGTNYKPLGSESQIRDALELLFGYIGSAENIYEKALLAVLGVSYIQPFIDGNKRTSRLLGNAILLANNYAPLSYRSVSDRLYKEACLIFYEQNSIESFKKIFVEQYIFAANTYNIARK